MRKLIAIIIVYLIICFLVPVLFTKRYKAKETLAKDSLQIKEYNYKQYNTIKLLHTKTKVVEELQLDDYICGVVAAEMPASYENEALKAQAVVARTYTIYKIKNKSNHDEANICDNPACCQAWISKEDRFAKWDETEKQANWEKILLAVEQTKGEIITYENEPINAFFHSNSGGITETADNVWGGTNYPYLQVVETSGESEYSQFSSEVSLSYDEVTSKIRQFHNDIEINYEDENAIEIIENTDSGRVKKIKFGNITISGTEARTIFGLKSAMFTIDKSEQGIIFKVKGYGHGVGMSQTGANSLAKQGNDYKSIINHYFAGVEIQKAFFE